MERPVPVCRGGIRGGSIGMPLEGNPQLEDGFTRIANELFDAVLRAPFTGREQKVVLAVIRLTYGYNKREDAISFGQVSLATGIGRREVIRAMDRLLAAHVLTRRTTGPRSPSVWAVQKQYQSWSLASGTRATRERKAASGAQATIPSGTSATSASGARATHQRQKDIKDKEKEIARRDRRPPTPVPPAVTVYREVTDLNPQKSWDPRLAETIGDDECELGRWREVCMRWIGLGWKKTNVAGMLDYFGRHELPGMGRGNGRDSPRAERVPLERHVADIPKGLLQEPPEPDEEPEL